MIPGRALLRVAARICCSNTLERVVEPAIADVQKEYADATGKARRAWTLVRGYLAIFKVMAMCALSVPVATDDDRQTIVRTIVWACALMVIFVAVLMIPPLLLVDGSLSGIFLAGLVPQAVPLAIPLGLAFGMAFGLGRRAATRVVVKTVLLSALLASLVSFVTLAWVIPAANQAFRQSVAQAAGITQPLTKGQNEMSFSELRREAETAAAAGHPRRAAGHAWTFHLRFALPLASVVLAGVLFAPAISSVTARTLVALLACLAYWVLIFVGEGLAVTLPAFVGAWLPNIGLGAAALLIASSRPSRRGRSAVAK